MEPTPADAAPAKPTFLKGKRLPSAIVAGGAAFAMTLAGLGIAAAQTDDATPPSTTAPADGDGDAGRLGRDHTHADHHPHARLSVAADALGMSTADLKTELEAGKSIAAVAESRSVDVQKVVDALVADATTMVNKAVEEGRITREQADARIADLPARMIEVVNHTRPAGAPEGDGEGHGKGPGRGPGIKAEAGKVAEVLGMTPEELRAGHEAGKSLATMAAEKGVDVQKVIDVLVADAKAHLAQAVTDGKLTQAQADERSANLVEHITNMVNHAPSADGERKGPGPRDGGKPNLDAAATALGITPEELRTELQAGKSLATIAGEKNVEVGKVVSALVADAQARLAKAVADGKLTQAQADERSADLETRITDLVNRVGRPHDGHRPGPGARADAENQPEAEPATLSA